MQELKEQEKQIIKVKKLPFTDSKEHVMNIGTTGSGKTLYELCEHILPAIQKGEPLIIVLGKNGSDDPYSLLNQTKRICAKYKRGLTIVSLDPRKKNRKKYNPFRNFKKIQMVDALNSMTEFSEAHYESAFRNWSMTILKLMERANRPFSLPKFLQYYMWESEGDAPCFISNLRIIEKEYNLTREEVDYFLAAKPTAKIVAESYSRLKDLCNKESVISDSKGAISIRQESLKKNVVFFDLDSFSYTKYTRQIGALIIVDIRSCIASLKIPQNTRCKVCLDELGSFCDKGVAVLYTQARAKNYQIIASIQDTTNLDSVQTGFSEDILALGRLAGEDAGNIAEKYIGTYSSVDTTRKSERAGLDGGETGSKRSVNKFRITPERLRNLSDKTVIYINKAKDRKIYESVMDVKRLPEVVQNTKLSKKHIKLK